MNSEQREQREVGLKRSCGFCEVCGKPLSEGQMQGAHLIGQTKTNFDRFGSFFINSPANIKIVCSLECNASCDVGKSEGKLLSTLADILTYEINKFNRG